MESDQRHPLASPNFWHILLATGMSGIGDQFAQFTLIWASVKLGHHGAWVAPIVLSRSVPMVILMVVGGAVGSKRPVRVLMWSGMFLAVVSFATGLLPLSGPILMGAGFLTGLADSVRAPTGQSLIALASPVQHLHEANRLRQIRFQVTRLVGPVAAGLLLHTIHIHHTFWVASGLFAVGSVGLWGSRVVQTVTAGRGIDWSVMRGGWEVLRSRSETLWMMGFYGLSNLAWMGPLQVGVPRLVSDIFHGGPTQLGLMNAAFGSGLLLGTLVFAKVGRGPGGMRLLFPFMAVSDFAMGFSGLSPGPGGVILAFAAAGLLFAPVGVLFNTYIQARTPPGMMAPVMSITTLTLQGVAPLSVLLSALFSGVDPRGLFLGAGGVATVADLVGWVMLKGRFDDARGTLTDT